MNAPATPDTCQGTSVSAARVWAVVYGDDVHVYPEHQAETAAALYTVGLAAYGDDNADIYHPTAQQWAAARARLPRDIRVIDHRRNG